MPTNYGYGMMDMLSVLRDMVFSKAQPKSVAQIADDLSWNQESLYKALNPNETHYNFPAKRLVPLMRSTGDLSILYHIIEQASDVIRQNKDRKWLSRLAALMGCEVVPVTGRMGKEAELDQLPREFGVFHQILKGMYATHRISDQEYETVRNFLSLAMGQVKAAEKVHALQTELDF